MENYCCTRNRYYSRHRYVRLNDYINCRIIDLEHYRQIGRVDTRAIDETVLLHVCRDIAMATGNTLDGEDYNDISRGMIIRVHDMIYSGMDVSSIKKSEPAIPGSSVDCIVEYTQWELNPEDYM